MAFSVAAALARPGEAPKAVAKINVGVSAGMVAGVPISNFLAEQISLSASMTFFAVATFLVLLATLWQVPSMPTAGRLSYGRQLAVLQKPGLWVSMLAVVFSILLLVYGLCNILGSILAGNILTTRPLTVVKVFPFLTAMLYGLMLLGASVWPYMGAVIILWGIFGGINGNINQYWIAKEAPEAPDFANGLFLTAA